MVQLPAAKDDLEETVIKTDSGDDANLELNQVAKGMLATSNLPETNGPRKRQDSPRSPNWERCAHLASNV